MEIFHRTTYPEFGRVAFFWLRNTLTFSGKKHFSSVSEHRKTCNLGRPLHTPLPPHVRSVAWKYQRRHTSVGFHRILPVNDPCFRFLSQRVQSFARLRVYFTDHRAIVQGNSLVCAGIILATTNNFNSFVQVVDQQF